ncbi:MAG: hypothetical protein WBG18_21420 [Xanthobacteraceae bacterium]
MPPTIWPSTSIDHDATIVGDRIFLDFDAPDLNVDIDDGRMHRIRPG